MRIAVGILALALGLAGHHPLQAKMLVSVQKALDKKLISARALGGGGFSIRYTVSNLAKDSVSLILPAGWRFSSDAGKSDYQDILMARDQLLVLRPKECKTFEVEGYFCEADLAVPAKGTPYTNGKMADNNLLELALFLNAHPADHHTGQYAVWAVSDNRPTAQITGSQDSVASLIRAFVAGIKHEPLPWFTLLKKVVVGSDGLLQEYPLKLKATLSYAIAATGYSSFYVLDANGTKVGQVTGQWLVPGSKNEYMVNLDLRGFKKGRYQLVLETAGSRLVEKEFMI